MPVRALHDVDELLLGFARALRAAGVPVTADRAQGFLAATAVVGLGDRRATYWAGRATLCSGPDDLDAYDTVFAAWFLEPVRTDRERRREAEPRPQAEPDDLSLEQAGDGDEDQRALASAVEVLRHRDVAELSAADRARLTALFATLQPRLPRRPAHRRTPWHHGEVDPDRTLRGMRSRMGEPGEIAWRRRAMRPRRVVLLVDVSGSMSGYADALLRLAHRFTVGTRRRGEGGTANGRASARAVETFTIGTRLTRVTPALQARDPERALTAAGRTVPDWSGGTRLGETLRAFLDRWGQRGLARGAVVVVFSDGWERGEPTLLAAQMQRLHRLAHRVVWVNPHVGKPGYQPVQQGIVAALPFVDRMVAGHSLAAFAELVEVVADA